MLHKIVRSCVHIPTLCSTYCIHFLMQLSFFSGLITFHFNFEYFVVHSLLKSQCRTFLVIATLQEQLKHVRNTSQTLTKLFYQGQTFRRRCKMFRLNVVQAKQILAKVYQVTKTNTFNEINDCILFYFLGQWLRSVALRQC